MNKKSILILVLILFTSAANSIFGFQINVDIDEDFSASSKECKLDRLDIKVGKNKDYKHLEISPIIASRSGIEFNIMTDSHKSKISMYEKIDSTNFKLKKTHFGNSVSGISIKYLPGNEDIPRHDKFDDSLSLTYLGEKTRQSYAIGFKNRDLHGKTENAGFDGFGMGFGYGFIIEDGVKQYVFGGNNYGKQDVDVHFYFEFEPTWENENFILYRCA